MKQPHFPGISQLNLKNIDLAFTGMAIHEAMVLCQTAPRHLEEGRPITDRERLVLERKLPGMCITPTTQLNEVIERFVLPDAQISVASFIINPVSRSAMISTPALEDLKKLTSSYIYFSAVGPKKHLTDPVSLRGVPLFFESASGEIVTPQVTEAGNLRFQVTPNIRYSLRYGLPE